MVSIINNITSLSRGAGSNQFDNIGFSYDGNQIVGLQDNSDWDNYLGEIPQIKQGDYPDAMSYDANGRITRDTSRGITSVAYNRLGLPSQINLGANDRVTTTYRSDGVKTMESNRHNYLATVIKVTTTGDTIYQQVKRSTITTHSYQGSLVRENGKPDRIYNEAGYIDIHPREDSVSYHYYIRDYLGSVRAVVDANGTIEQAAGYHSGGIPSSEYGSFSADNRLHTGKEFNNFAGLAWYDNNARMYDPILTRFTTPDPLAEKYPDQSPYAHCANNPLNTMDPTGLFIIIKASDYAGSDLSDFIYSVGIIYEGKDQFIKDTANALNKISKYGGETLITDLINSNKEYTYNKSLDKFSIKETVKGAEIAVNNNFDNFVSAVGHETMHAGQYENGQGGAFTQNEIEAYAFEKYLEYNSYDDSQLNSQIRSINVAENIFDNKILDLCNQIANKQNIDQNIENAIQIFKQSSYNNSGLYNGYSDKRQRINLINKYFTK